MNSNPIRDARVARGFSLRQLAQRAGISHTAVRLAEAADPSTLSVRVKIAIARGLGLPPSQLARAFNRYGLAQTALADCDHATAAIDHALALPDVDPELAESLGALRSAVTRARNLASALAPVATD